MCQFDSSSFMLLLLTCLFVVFYLPTQIQPYHRVFGLSCALCWYSEEMYVLYSSVPAQLCHWPTFWVVSLSCERLLRISVYLCWKGSFPSLVYTCLTQIITLLLEVERNEWSSHHLSKKNFPVSTEKCKLWECIHWQKDAFRMIIRCLWKISLWWDK